MIFACIIQFSGIKYTCDVVQLSPISNFRTFSSSQTETVKFIKNISDCHTPHHEICHISEILQWGAADIDG